MSCHNARTLVTILRTQLRPDLWPSSDQASAA